jgi:uncharacterized membrane protein YdjX (TVP38/TMEM64 family)
MGTMIPDAQKKKRRFRENGRFSASALPGLPEELRQNLAYARWFLASTLLFAALLLAFLVGRQPIQELWELLSDQTKVSAYLQSFGAWGPLVLGIMQFLQVLIVVIPGPVFLIAAGYVYGFTWGFIMNLAYVVAASQLAFLIARWAGRPLVERLVPEEIPNRWYKIGKERGFAFSPWLFCCLSSPPT